jgi:hypothetical protein
MVAFMPLLRRLAVLCLAIGLFASGLPDVSWAGTGHLRHERRQAARQAARLDARAHSQAASLAQIRRALDRLNAQANDALAELQRTTLEADRAREAADAARAALDAARQRTAAARATLDEMAAGAYRTMAAGGQLASALSLVQTGNPQTFMSGLQVLGQVGRGESDAVDALRLAEAGEIRSEHVVTAAEDRAVATQRGAAAAKQVADALVAEQRQQAAAEQRLLAATRSAANQAHTRTQKLDRRIRAAEARAAAIRAAEARSAAAYTGPIPTCNGGSVSGYGNGQLPVSALCALWGAPGQMLRADAAAAFNRMSKAYAAAFGTPLCVTSSYRTYAKQVELYATMPAGYAAVPGTSNHGWGLAVDLCGGIQVDGSPQHMWLLSNAAAYDWFHPAWALPGGGGPHEPWHWEYAG